nr:hypothetical protein [uncultured Caproiciproducens sp.]
MNQHKKIWLLLLMLTFVYSFYSVTALATEITPEQVQQIIDQQSSKASSQQTGSSSSSKSTASSKKSVSSRKSVSSVLSSDASSELSSGLSSDLFSSEEVSSEIILPSVNSVEENNPLSSVIVDSAANKQMKWIGILSWVCIVLGIIVVLIVVFSNRRPPRGGPGRKRYRRPSRTHKKRLLNDKYYRNIKY